jgi:dienelactone hydrolase
MKYFTIILLVMLVVLSSAQAAVVGKDVEYRDGDTLLKGFLAYDDSVSNKRPGILVVHEWWGHNEYARNRARMLARLGYTALAVDMYGDGKRADHPDDAGKFAGELRENMDLAESRFRAALLLLQEQDSVDPDRIAAIGYCFGGGVVLEMARRGVELDGVASYHGSLGTSSPAESGKVVARVLVFNGADDPFVSGEQIVAFRKEMDEAGVDYRFVSYPGVKHSFTNPDADVYGKKFDLPLEYNADADRASWSETQEFFREIFR